MNIDREKIFVFGASGHSKVVIDIIEQQHCFDIALLADDDETIKDSCTCGYRIIGGKEELLASSIRYGLVAIGNNKARLEVASWLSDHGFELISAVHPVAQLARSVIIGAGTVVMAGAVVNSDSRIGNNVIINTRASIDHDCVIGDGVHIAPGAILCGSVSVGKGTFICAGATIIPNITIGTNAVIGAGSVVIKNVSDNVRVVGNPARIVHEE